MHVGQGTCDPPALALEPAPASLSLLPRPSKARLGTLPGVGRGGASREGPSLFHSPLHLAWFKAATTGLKRPAPQQEDSHHQNH